MQAINALTQFRLVCLFGALLAFPNIYMTIGAIIALSIILLAALLMFGVFSHLDNDIENAVKAFLFTLIVILTFFAFTIFANALKFLYILCTFCFLFVQD